MTSSDDSAIGQRRQLGAALRSFRKEAGMDRDAAAELIEITGPTLTRKERGENKFKRQEVEILARAYGINRDELDVLLELAREARAGTKRGEFPLFLPVKDRAFLELERDEAIEILAVTLSAIPLYFQTEEYMRTLWLSNGDLQTSERVDELVRLRRSRQQVVSKAGAPKIRAIIHEFALRLPVGGPEVMRRQLLSLAQACDLPNVEIQVQPISAGAYPGIDSTFYALRFASGPASDMVQVHGHSEAFYRDRPAATEPYMVEWDRRKVAALNLPASKALILDAAADFGT
ncbi:helix-turn-helix domain-containing protein [Amycolatopsis cihanbeyliensis]|uniref:helix-turn-helix domain-containing protein n=1 Tax=Amycolatopsis cihanbeyliensis TaxID=1128664 RepID=UPI001476AB18|nr:helix-turn-helix transcriptional regulator [Amycolatopsis cihanbeyliensis]